MLFFFLIRCFFKNSWICHNVCTENPYFWKGSIGILVISQANISRIPLRILSRLSADIFPTIFQKIVLRFLQALFHQFHFEWVHEKSSWKKNHGGFSVRFLDNFWINFLGNHWRKFWKDIFGGIFEKDSLLGFLKESIVDLPLVCETLEQKKTFLEKKKWALKILGKNHSKC